MTRLLENWIFLSVVFAVGMGLGCCAMKSAEVNVEYQRKQREMYERCCSCTQSELGQCGR